MARRGPTVRMRRLANELLAARHRAGMSRERASEAVGVDYVTLYRIERAQARPQRRNLDSLLQVYDVPGDRSQYIINLATNAKMPGWFQAYPVDYNDVYAAYRSFEQESSTVRHYDSLCMPGLLQTPEYVEALVRGMIPGASDELVRQRVRLRVDRQGLLLAPRSLQLNSVIDEAVLCRQVGGRAVWLAQLRHLVVMLELANITLQVIPFRSGAHPGMSGHFAMLDFSDARDSSLVLVDWIAGNEMFEDPSDVAHYTTTFDQLRAESLSRYDSLNLIKDMINDGQALD